MEAPEIPPDLSPRPTAEYVRIRLGRHLVDLGIPTPDPVKLDLAVMEFIEGPLEEEFARFARRLATRGSLE